MEDTTTLQLVWFILISVLWIGYFILEGFDFGVGMLMKLIGGNKEEKRAILHTIGPIWDGNEVWLIVAGGATFAAFPEWYATLFSGFYIALFGILIALIVRNVGFEMWGKRDTDAWRNGWEWCIALGSLLPALLWGVAWANIIGGTPIEEVSSGNLNSLEFVGNFFDLLSLYALLGGLASLAIFFAHGALFLELRTEGEVREKARGVAVKATPVAAVLAAIFMAWTLIRQDSLEILALVSAVIAVGAFVFAIFNAKENPARAFAGTAAGIAFYFIAQFVDLFPNAMVSSIDSAFDMTLNVASSTNYTLTVMTVVAVLLLPVVLLYQAWTYWVFRHRLSADGFGEVKSPIDLLDKNKREVSSGPDTDQGTGG
ncbi:MAG: cytochrome d ubiquinol oxidase subunit II [Solirubrobacterales bacterium]|nr:cytochrome d ubiquinol oxidase subunit II [Solirubrobacterales bacterium]HMT05542.1 cytochrome d ubiquinol oxidase subunit II [Solirubrobacterales bacterium]